MQRLHLRDIVTTPNTLTATRKVALTPAQSLALHTSRLELEEEAG